jgi:16S rRNA (uracil1498-N3)-methyltransferase
MRRFLAAAELQNGMQVQLSAQESRHALKVLRLKAGDTILLTDGKGREAEGRILRADPEGALVEVGKTRSVERAVRLEVLQAPLKGPKMDWLVEKLTEMGVAEIHLIQSRYTVGNGEKLERWERIVQAAVKQSGNVLVPRIHPLQPIEKWLQEPPPGGLGILLEPGAQRGLAQVIQEAGPCERILLAIGPEGGFSEEESRMFQQAGFVPASLSRQILRGETAAIAAVAIAAHSIDF